MLFVFNVSAVKFEIGCGNEPKSPINDEETIEFSSSWEIAWECQTATPIHHMAFSPDGTLFATCGKNDRLVKIWYEHKTGNSIFKRSKKLNVNVMLCFIDLFPSKSVDYAQSMSFGGSELDFGFIYIAHPRAVTHISWRKTSKHMPKGSVSNMLVTSCIDNICRIWVETILPDDGLVNMNQFDPLASQNPKFRTHRHKHRFMQRLKHMKTCFHIRRHAKNHGPSFGSFQNEFGVGTIPTLPSTYSVHDFHSYGFHGTGVTPALHFHIAASINAETDIPLVPSMQTNDPIFQPNFVLHWLNNKEMHFTMQAENLLQELARKVVEIDDQNNSHYNNNDGDGNTENTDGLGTTHEDVKKKLTKLKSYSHEESMSDEHNYTSNRSQSIGAGSLVGVPMAHHSLSNTTSINSLVNESTTHVPDSLDMKIECLLRDWHHSGDLLFSIHPIDGSFLIWVIDWLDESYPGKII